MVCQSKKYKTSQSREDLFLLKVNKILQGLAPYMKKLTFLYLQVTPTLLKIQK